MFNPLAIAERAVPIPQIAYVVLHIYVDQPRQPNDEVVIYAMCAELWIGEKPVAMTQPQHTFGRLCRKNLLRTNDRYRLYSLKQQFQRSIQ
ncbi:hypothetical protein IFO70_38635 [Phormidium tenue FACHB-886]|nr:hypothetical protein [Phormidium tenue FACHB-886]